MAALERIFVATWQVCLVASPYVLIGLAGAGLLHILVPADRIARWLGREGFGATARAACLGIPLPLCSCAVVPITIELARKGASREASLAFLVSTPETGVDSILVTYGLMGPVMAIARPVAALATSLVAGLSSMLWRDPPETTAPPAPEGVEASPASADSDGPSPPLDRRLREAVRYGFKDMVDEIGFWLVGGLLLTGIITALVPEELIRGALGEGPGSLVLLLLLGVPLYMCASASTPVAAALMLKGISPGAALVFLLAGPATNASSLVVIARFFGRRFVAIYLSSVVVTALLAGWSFDLLLRHAGVVIQPALTTGDSEAASWLELASAVLLAALLVASLLRGSWRMAIRELANDLRSWRATPPPRPTDRRLPRPRLFEGDATPRVPPSAAEGLQGGLSASATRRQPESSAGPARSGAQPPAFLPKSAPPVTSPPSACGRGRHIACGQCRDRIWPHRL